MIDQQHCTAAMNLVAIDVAKDWNVVLVQDAMGQRQSFRVANRAADHKQFVELLQALPGRVRVALEPTGDYHRPLAYRLLQEGFEVVSISSVAQARFREARYGTWDKNDPKDAQVILAMLEQGLVQTYYDPLWQGTHDWQELSNTYFQITLARTRLQHSLLLHHLPLYFPEFLRYWQSTRSAWFVRFLLRFPTPAAIRQLDRESFIAEAWDLVGRKGRQACQAGGDLYHGGGDHRAACLAGLARHRDLPPAVGSLRRVESATPATRRTSPGTPCGELGLPAATDSARDRRHHGLDDSGRGRRSAPLPASPPVSEVLRTEPGQEPVGAEQGPRSSFQTRQ